MTVTNAGFDSLPSSMNRLGAYMRKSWLEISAFLHTSIRLLAILLDACFLPIEANGWATYATVHKTSRTTSGSKEWTGSL